MNGTPLHEHALVDLLDQFVFALVGALAAWQSGGNAKETAIFAGLLFGAIGFISGFFRGASRGRGNREFVLGPVERGKGGDSEEGGRRRRR